MALFVWSGEAAARSSLLDQMRPSQVRAMLQSGGRTLPPTGRYVSESGESFIFDRSGQRPLFRFQSRNETWALRGTPAPRGDIIYRNDAGDQILRVTPDGGMTLYSQRNPNGSPASMAGPAPSLARPMLGPVQLANLMVQRSALMSRALGRTVTVQLDGEQDEALCIDALMVTTDAVLRMAGSPTMRDQLRRLRTVTITEGRAASVAYASGDLRVTVLPLQGTTGRPSSARIIQAVRRD
ncbi:MAG: DUF4908 domain-containing protein [Caulobacteraceae bacterium]|nr:MAG: DUF4908 domain-containing protein [Caulobacteraceae bacterium]